MSEETQKVDYTIGQKVVHWLMALLIIMDLFIAQKFGGEMTVSDRFESRSDHASVGFVVTVLFALRVYLRIKHGAPALPINMKAWEQKLSQLAHFAFYLLIAGLIATGILSAVFANSVVAPFGAFALGNGVGNADLYGLVRSIHALITQALILLIILHIIAALYHLFVMRDGVMGRMLKVWGQVRRGQLP